jgi:hypothetical protein
VLPVESSSVEVHFVSTLLDECASDLNGVKIVIKAIRSENENSLEIDLAIWTIEVDGEFQFTRSSKVEEEQSVLISMHHVLDYRTLYRDGTSEE